MDLQKFLSLQRKQLEQDRQRLNALNINNSQKSDSTNKGKGAETSSPCPAALLMQTENFVPGQCQRRMANANENECNEPHNASTSALATVDQNSELQLELDLGLSEPEPEQDVEEEVFQDGGTKASTSLIKSAKEFVNQRELLVGSARPYKSPNASHRSLESERPQSENRLPIGRHKKAVSRGAPQQSGCGKCLAISMFTLDWRNAKNFTCLLLFLVLSITARNALRLVDPISLGFHYQAKLPKSQL